MSIFTLQQSGTGASCHAFVDSEVHLQRFCNDVDECIYSEAPAVVGVPMLMAGGGYGIEWCRTFFRFANILIPRSSYINGATLKLWVTQDWVPGSLRAFVENANSPTLPMDFGTAKARGLSSISEYQSHDRLSIYSTYAMYLDGTIRGDLPTVEVPLGSGAELTLAQITLNITEIIQYAISARWWDYSDAMNIILSEHSGTTGFYYAGYSEEYAELAPLLTIDHDNMAVKIQVGATITDDLEHNHPAITEVVTVEDKLDTNWPFDGEQVMAFDEVRGGFQRDVTVTEHVTAAVDVRAGFEDSAVAGTVVVAAVTFEAQFELVFTFALELGSFACSITLTNSFMLTPYMPKLAAAFEISSTIFELDGKLAWATGNAEFGKAFNGELSEFVADLVYYPPPDSYEMEESLPSLEGLFAIGNTLEASADKLVANFEFSIEGSLELEGKFPAPTFSGTISVERVFSLEGKLPKIEAAFEYAKKVILALDCNLPLMRAVFDLDGGKPGTSLVLSGYTKPAQGDFVVTIDSAYSLTAVIPPVRVFVTFWNDSSDDVEPEVLRYKDKL